MSLVGLVIFVGATSRTEMFRLWGIGKPKNTRTKRQSGKNHEATCIAAKDPPGFYYTVGEESAVEIINKLVIHTRHGEAST